MYQIKNPYKLIIHIRKVGWFKYEILTDYIDENNEFYARGTEYAFSVIEAQKIINNNYLWAIIKRNVDSENIHLNNHTNKYFFIKKLKYVLT